MSHGLRFHRRAARDLRAPRDVRSERGNSLLLAMLFVISIAFIGGVSMEYAFSTIRDNVNTRDAQAARYGAAGAVDLMVAAMRNSLSWGRDGQSCPSVSLTLSDGRTATATCAPVTGSGELLAEGNGARASRVVDVVATVGGVPFVKSRITLNDAAGSHAAANVVTREWDSAP